MIPILPRFSVKATRYLDKLRNAKRSVFLWRNAWCKIWERHWSRAYLLLVPLFFQALIFFHFPSTDPRSHPRSRLLIEIFHIFIWISASSVHERKTHLGILLTHYPFLTWILCAILCAAAALLRSTSRGSKRLRDSVSRDGKRRCVMCEASDLMPDSSHFPVYH